MAEHTSAVAHQFDDAEQQRAVSTLGMWVFLAQEIMFFGGAFCAYVIYRTLFPEAFGHASVHLDVRLGTFNTAVLIASSLSMALAVHAAQTGARRAQVGFLALTIALGAAFLGIKAIEYHHKFVEHLVPGAGFHMEGFDGPQAQIFFSLYFGMTGMHALHMIVGVGLLLWLMVQGSRNRFSPEYFTPVEVTGLYWHFVDIVWIFLFPLLYLLGRT